MTDKSHDMNRLDMEPVFRPAAFGHPEDVLADITLSTQDKRALLAAWASDANAVPHVPSLRQLPDGSIAKVDDILRALKALDTSGEVAPDHGHRTLLWRRPFARRRGFDLRKWSRYNRRSDDDDDPPPCPVGAAIPPRSGGGTALAHPEPVAA